MTPKSQDPKEFLRHASAQPSEKTAKIAFRGTPKYRQGLDVFATSRGETVQNFIEKAIDDRARLMTAGLVPPVPNPKPIPSEIVPANGEISVIVSEAQLPWVKQFLSMLTEIERASEGRRPGDTVTGEKSFGPEIAAINRVEKASAKVEKRIAKGLKASE